MAADRAAVGPAARRERRERHPTAASIKQLGGQIGWLLPLALLGLVGAGGALFARPARQRWLASGQHAPANATDERAPATKPRFFSRIRQCLRGPLNPSQQSTALWGTWFLTMVAFFSVAGFFHRYYLSMLAPAVAALVGIALAVLWRAYRHRRPLGWLLPVALVVTAAVQAKILADYPAYAHWMTPLIVGGGVVAAIGLTLARLRPVSILRRQLAVAAATAGLMILLLAPTVWAGVSVRDANGGGIPAAGPSQQGQGFPGGGPGGNGDGTASASTSGLLDLP